MEENPSVLAEVLLRYLQLPRFASGDPGTPLFCGQSNEVSERLRAVFRTVRTASERLGGAPIPIFPYRFRYTLGTRAIQLGASDHEAARLLTHRSTRCVHYYRASLPALQKPIADAIGPEMGFIAKAFQGRLIGTLEQATRKGQPGAVIRDFAHLVGQRLGACGTNAGASRTPPRLPDLPQVRTSQDGPVGTAARRPEGGSGRGGGGPHSAHHPGTDRRGHGDHRRARRHAGGVVVGGMIVPFVGRQERTARENLAAFIVHARGLGYFDGDDAIRGRSTFGTFDPRSLLAMPPGHSSCISPRSNPEGGSSVPSARCCRSPSPQRQRRWSP